MSLSKPCWSCMATINRTGMLRGRDGTQVADLTSAWSITKCAAKVMMVRKTGKQNGVQARIQAIVMRAVYTHCKAHWLNHANIHASDSMHAKNMMATALTIASAIDYFAKRLLRFYENLETDAMGT
ncbi:hypothetical protein DPMN_090488 [Dreissena polymorpha]|uniref:Uncharacterized protein n=1 Tax=Dreissena polymorpha TaxID=45954 RepID=A0A9D4KXT7_DREPO|nr:hypothetical protein DPMN_090488 [Dreissena polymorpha]